MEVTVIQENVDRMEVTIKGSIQNTHAGECHVDECGWDGGDTVVPKRPD